MERDRPLDSDYSNLSNMPLPDPTDYSGIMAVTEDGWRLGKGYDNDQTNEDMSQSFAFMQSKLEGRDILADEMEDADKKISQAFQTLMLSQQNAWEQMLVATGETYKASTGVDLYPEVLRGNTPTGGVSVTDNNIGRPLMGYYEGQPQSTANMNRYFSSEVNAINPILPPEQGDWLAAYSAMNMTVANRLNKLDGFRKWGDLAISVVVPFRDIYYGRQEIDEAINKVLFKHTGKAPGGINKILNYWHTLSPAEQTEIFDDVEKAVWKASGRNFSPYIQYIYPMIDKTDKGWLYASEAADVLSVPALIKAPRVLARIAKAKTLKVRAAVAGNNELAGKSILWQIDKKTARATGEEADKSRLLARIEADPAMSQVDNATVGRLSSVVQKVSAARMRLLSADIMLNRQQILDAVNTILPFRKQGLLLDSEIEGVRKKLTAAYPNAVEIKMTKAGNWKVRMEMDNPPFDAATELRPLQGAFDQLGEQLKSVRADIRDTLDMLEVGTLSKADKQALEASYRSSLEEAVAIRKEMEAVTDEMKQVRQLGKQPEKTVEEVVYNVTIDDVGAIKFDEKARTGGFSRAFLAKESTIDRILDTDAVDQFTVNEWRAIKFSQEMKRIVLNIRKDLNLLYSKKNMAKVDEWLRYGDEIKSTFGVHELQRGTPDLPRLNWDEVQAYYKMRDVLDTFWYINNRVRREGLDFDGWKAASVAQDGDRLPTVFVKPSEIIKEIPHIGGRSGPRIKEALDLRTGKIVTVDSEEVKKLVADKRLGFMRTKEQYMVEGRQGRYVLVELGEDGKVTGNVIKELPPVVLEKRTGYVPKIPKRLNFLVEETKDALINGVTARTSKIIRGFETREEARRWFAAKKSAKNEKWQIYSAHDYRTGKAERASELDDSLFLGAFSAHREDNSIRYGLRGTEAERLSAWESIDLYNEYLQQYMDANAYKNSMIRRFENTIEELRKQGHPVHDEGQHWSDPFLTKKQNEPWFSDLLAYQEAMKMWFAIPTQSEKAWSAGLSKIARGIEKGIIGGGEGKYNRVVKNTASVFHSLAAKDPSTELRRLTFGYMFGLNPMQLIVQSMGMYIPAAAHPIQAAAALPEFLVMRAAWGTDNIRTLKYFADAAGIKPSKIPYIEDMFRNYKKSGIGESVLQNPDYGTSVLRRSQAVTPQAWRELWNKGLAFYKSGELNTRTLAWVMAYRDYLKKTKKTGKALKADDIDAITKESLRRALNMGPGNAAAWQRGIAGTPTQFWQIGAKFFENLIKGMFGMQGARWTKQEAWTSFFISTMLFGSYSLPMGENMRDTLKKNIMTWLTGTGVGGMGFDPETDYAELTAMEQIFYSFLHGGLMDVTLNEVVTQGENPGMFEFSRRFGIASGTMGPADNWIDPALNYLRYEEDPSLLQVLAGASGSMMDRRFAAFGDMVRMFGVWRNSDDLTEDQWLRAFGALSTSLVSQGSNSYQALLWDRANDLVDPKTGKPLGLVPLGEEIDPRVVMAKHFGITSQKQEQFAQLRRSDAKYEKAVKFAAQQVAERFNFHIKNKSFATDEDFEALINEVNFLLSPFDDYPVRKGKVMEQAWKELYNAGTPYQELMMKIFKMRLDYGEYDLPDYPDTTSMPTLEKPNAD